MPVSLRAAVKNNLLATNYFFVRESTSENGNSVFILTKKVSGRPVSIHLEVIKGGVMDQSPEIYVHVHYLSFRFLGTRDAMDTTQGHYYQRRRCPDEGRSLAIHSEQEVFLGE
jgi:hypothetical protein